ncbi:solute carrier family 22 member 5-like isoform X2 [Xiphophorus hellerii]|uniref:solute carrier family 22 member 5-like isoform X2 n=1 Tax=Xiphophorus hellerii TaxID=8084 RepID=UPI0013B41C16|nr:solute carrier family 22 member 5-like isoform X2 [Xiphophorus hellerii]
MKDYEEIVAFLDQWGCFQKAVFLLLCASIIPNGFGAFNLVFLTDVPDHHCFIPDLNLSEEWRKSIIPKTVLNGKQELNRCSRYRLDVVQNLSDRGLIPGRDINLTDLEEERCVDGWSYSTDIYLSTVVTEFDLVCSDQWAQPFTTSVFFIGVLVGSFFSGQLSDRYGRKPILFATMAAQTIFTFAQVFSTSWTMFVILLFFNGLGQISNFVAALVLGFSVGYILLPVVAYFLRDWKSLLMALSLPCLAYIPLWWLLPESPRWLLSRGRVKEAEAVIRKAARWNKVQTPTVIFETDSVNETKSDKKPSSVLDLFRNSSIRIITVILCLVYFAMTTGYFSLSFNTAQLHADPYMSCFIAAVVEIPAYVSSWIALRFLPRRLSVSGTLILGSLPLFILLLVPEDLFGVSLALEMVGKYAFTTGASLMFAYTTELYPTSLRNTATGTTTTVSRTGSCISPFLLSLDGYFSFLPYVTIGSLGAVTAFVALLLPETFKQPLPETLQQMHERQRTKCPCIQKTEASEPVVLPDSPL